MFEEFFKVNKFYRSRLTGTRYWTYTHPTIVVPSVVSAYESAQRGERSMDSSKKYDYPSPELSANVFSKFFFCWIFPFFKRGYNNDLELKDIYSTTPGDQCGHLADELEKNWEIEVIILKSLHPIILAEYIRYFEDTAKYNEELGQYSGWVLGSGVVLVAFLIMVLLHHAHLGCQRIGMRVRVACSSLVYRKLLKLNQASLGKAAPGKLVNLLSNDLQRFDLASMYLHYIWLMPIQAVVGFYIMYRNVGVAALAGMIAMVLEGIPLQGYLSKIQGKYRFQIAEETDHRVKLMNEIMAGIRVIKMYAWEKSFAKIVEIAREKEINVISKTSYVRGVSLSMMVFTERLSLYLTIVAFVLLGNELTSEAVFSMAQLFNTAQMYICIFYPNALATYAEAKVSVGRLEEFLSLEENGSRAVLNGVVSAQKLGRIKTEKATASWSLYPTMDTLMDINLDIAPGTLCCVVGSVGSGKSSLLHMLLRELPLNCGRVDISGEISYASQEPWLFVSSVRDNILFGRPYVKQRYDEVVRVCALETDFLQFPFGDRTPVEERGVSLSGGQRARINLARAVYATADVYLFDDPLSAVDTHVSKHLLEQCIRGYLRNKTRILVTHQLQVLKQADLVVIIEKGRIQKIGTYAEISENELTNLHTVPHLDEKLHETDLRKKSWIAEISQDQFMDEEEPQENKEAMEKGSIPLSTYWKYYRHGASVCFFLFVAILIVVAQAASNACDLWVTHWTNMEATIFNTTNVIPSENMTLSTNTTPFANGIRVIEPDPNTLYRLDNISPLKDTINDTYPDYEDEKEEEKPFFPIEPQEYYIIVYSVFMLASILLTPARSILFYKIFMTASKNLHNKMFTNVLAAPMRFFDTNPSGRILSRFSNDMGLIDELLPKASLDAVQVFMVLGGILAIVFIVSPWMMVPAGVLAIVFYYLRMIYIRTAQSVKRLEGVNRAPVFSHILASLYGMPTIRASKAQDMVISEFDALQDQHTSTWFMYLSSSEIFGFYLDLISTVFIAIVTFQFIVFKSGSETSGDVGLVISQSLILTGMLQIGVRQTAEVASNMISVERVLQYTKLEREANAEEDRSAKNMSEDWSHYATMTYMDPDKNWPQSGAVRFKNVFLMYAADAPPVLKNLNVEIEAGEKVGIVGRTGAGKSTLISALFRLAPIEGAIVIDGTDTSRLRLRDLRSKISIIPQEPVLFSSTIRYNLDPFDVVSDEGIWQALENVELKNAIENLDQNVCEGGSNFSAGQRQLLCLARAIVRNNKVLVLDEATANVDPNTDLLIQKTIRENFKHCTVLTIAHRLNTIMDNDKVLVMDAGEAVEFAHPHVLLQNPEGYFTRMVRQTGPSMEASLRKIAKDHFDRND
ncbi:hypothetical protein JTB14_037665 [Gonioctena quinquepunctata]|nr:hypothetical protein JTB14_037665 [Gonioctena quinquepunctata]